MPNSDRMAEAKAVLERFVAQAADYGADTIEFERVSDGFEVSYFAGHTGIGTVLQDRELEAALVELVHEQTRKRRTFEVDVRGQSVTVNCEWYQSFGEDCFHLRFVKAKSGSDARRETRQP